MHPLLTFRVQAEIRERMREVKQEMGELRLDLQREAVSLQSQNSTATRELRSHDTRGRETVNG